MSLVFETKLALFEALRVAVPDGTQCTFAQTGKADRRKQVWFGESTDDELTSAAFSATAKKPTNVSAYVDVHALTTSPGDPVAAERGVDALRDSIVDACVAVDRTSVPGLQDLRPESASVETGESTDGAYSMMTVRVRIRGRVMQ